MSKLQFAEGERLATQIPVHYGVNPAIHFCHLKKTKLLFFRKLNYGGSTRNRQPGVSYGGLTGLAPVHYSVSNPCLAEKFSTFC
ncbi:hypothetical protein QQP08_001312 [Theobroma cacao]|nr:hypothetical protein QQP08_001312 [Theobroma cacao]